MAILNKQKQLALKPAGYSAVAEALVKPMIFIGSTLLVTIACYALAKNQLISVISGQFTAQDVLVLILVGGLGVLMDTVINIAASRFRMHMARGARDRVWAIINGLVLVITLGAEGMTLLYFGYEIDPADTPTVVANIIPGIHNALYFLRYPAIPLLLFYLIAGVLPLTIEAADRDRQTKATTSVNIAGLQEDLIKVAVGTEATVEDKIRALADQHAINEHASHATAEEIKRNAILINKLCAQNGLPPMVSVDGEDVALPTAKVTQVIITPVPSTNGHHVATEPILALPEVTEEPFVAEMANSVASPQGNPQRPKPSQKSFPKWVYQQAYTLMRDRTPNQPVNLATLADETGYDAPTVAVALRTYRPTVESQLKRGESMADNIVYANSGFYLIEASTN